MTRHTTRAAVAAAGIALAILAPTTPAGAVRVESPTRDHGSHRVAYVERVELRRFYVETADGAAYRVRRCVTEDDPRPCLWNAARRGNGAGTSFVRVHPAGRELRVAPGMMRRAYLPVD